jgi:hypothetical protein
MQTHFESTALEHLVYESAQLTQLVIEQNSVLERIATALESLVRVDTTTLRK